MNTFDPNEHQRASPWLTTNGIYVVRIESFFRRNTNNGNPALHGLIVFHAQFGDDGLARYHGETSGKTVTKQFPLEGLGTFWFADLLRVLDVPGVDKFDDEAITKAVAFRPWVGTAQLSPPVPRRNGSGTHQFMNIVKIDRYDPRASKAGLDFSGTLPQTIFVADPRTKAGRHDPRRSIPE